MILTAAELVDATQEELPPDIPSFVEAHLVYGESTFRILRHRHGSARHEEDIRRYPTRVNHFPYSFNVGLVKDFKQAPHLKWS